MSVIRTLIGGGQIFFCPGCRDTHAVNMRVRSDGPRWTYNGDVDRPTFTPSILHTVDWPDGREVCHSFVRDGRIQFLSDCTHALANRTVDLPQWPYAPGTYGGIDETNVCVGPQG